MISDTQSAQTLQKQDGHNIYAIMKTMCLPGYHHNGFVATHVLGHMMPLQTVVVFFLQNATLEFQILLCLNKIVFSCFIVEQSISNHVSLCKVCFAC